VAQVDAVSRRGQSTHRECWHELIALDGNDTQKTIICVTLFGKNTLSTIMCATPALDSFSEANVLGLNFNKENLKNGKY
jgi:hypothetical protein